MCSDLAACVDVSAWVADGDGADDLAMIQHTQLSGVARDAGPDQRISRERHGLHLPVCTHVERVRTGSIHADKTVLDNNVTSIIKK